jgi:hypothetical protein
MIRIAAIATVLAFAFAANAQAATLKADYRFENSLTSSVTGAPDLTNAAASTRDANGPNTFTKLPEGTRKIPVLHFQRDGGVVGPAYPLISKSSYTAVVDFQFTGTYDGFWRRILDLSNGTSDDGFYVAPSDLLNYWDSGIYGTTAFINEAWHQVVLTRVGSTKVVSEYLDGNLEAIFADNTTPPIALVPTTNTIFFQDNPPGTGPACESSDGYVSRIRLYTGALSSTAVAALKVLPPAPSVAAPSSVSADQSYTVTGKNFGPDEQVSIYFTDATNTTTVLTTATTDASGGFSMSEQVPISAPSGNGTFSAFGQASTLKAKHAVSVTAT